MTEPRVPMLDPESARAAAKDVGIPEDMARLSIFRVLLQHPTLAGAAYKLLYLLADRCPSTSGALNDAVAASALDDNAAHKAAVVRYAFDAILGVPADAPQAPQP